LKNIKIKERAAGTRGHALDRTRFIGDAEGIPMKTIPFSRSISSVSTVKPMFRSFRFSARSTPRDRTPPLALFRQGGKKKAGFALLSGAR